MAVQQVLITGCLAFLMAAGMSWAAEAPKMRMTTKVPEGIATPDRLETSLGTLTSVDGVPDVETTQTDAAFENYNLAAPMFSDQDDDQS